MKLLSPSQCQSGRNRWIQLRSGANLQPEQPAMGGPGRLERQRQHEGIHSLQLPARSAVVPGGPVVAQRDQVPYPSPVSGKNKSDSITGTITHVFSPTMTNETVVAYTFIGFPNVFADSAKVDRAAVGLRLRWPDLTQRSLFLKFRRSVPSEAAVRRRSMFNPGGFEAGGKGTGLYANKYMPSVSDILTKVVKTHTLKAVSSTSGFATPSPPTTIPMGYMQFHTPGNAK